MTDGGFALRGLDHICVTVGDMDAAVAFYLGAFGGEVLYRMGPLDARDMPAAHGKDWTEAHIDVPDAQVQFTGIRLAKGALHLEIYQYDRPAGNRTAPRNFDVGGGHIALRVDNIEAATAHLASKGFVRMDGLIEPPDGPLLGSRSQYLRDPFGCYVELTEYDSMAFMQAGDTAAAR